VKTIVLEQVFVECRELLRFRRVVGQLLLDLIGHLIDVFYVRIDVEILLIQPGDC
jgi:hypothetical protein